MNVIWIVGMIAGVTLAFRRSNFFALVPLIVVLAATTSVAAWGRSIFTDLFYSVALPQCGYLLGVTVLMPLGMKSPTRPLHAG
jgi:hypothetical protein